MLKLIPTILLTLAFVSCLTIGDGTNTFIKETSNPKHDKKAILFLKESGATVSDSYQVTVAGNNKKFDKTKVGNTFTVDTDDGKTWLDSASINFTWLGNDTLQIDYDKKLRTFIQQKKVDEVTIIYKAR